MSRPGRLYVVIATMCVITAFAGPGFAQSGSAGGSLISPESIGKTGKSLSSRPPKQLPPVSPPQAAQPHRAAPAKKATSRSRCPSIIGTWSSWAAGITGRNDTTFGADGSAVHRMGIRGRWWCESGVLHIEWPDGRPGVVKRSADGKTITGEDGIVHMRRD